MSFEEVLKVHTTTHVLRSARGRGVRFAVARAARDGKGRGRLLRRRACPPRACPRGARLGRISLPARRARTLPRTRVYSRLLSVFF